MLISDFDYNLPENLIAQAPLEKRENSRMLIVDRRSGELADRNFYDLPELLRDGDVVVLNNTRVFPARLFGRSETGAKVEIFLVRETSRGIWETLARPARRLKTGKKIIFGEKLIAEVIDKTEDGRVRVRFEADGDFDRILDEIGRTPCPRTSSARMARSTPTASVIRPFLRGSAAPSPPRPQGSISRPEILEKVKAKGVTVAEVTLHVGYGTFEPVRVRDLSLHSVMPEQYEIGAATAETLNRAKAEGRRIVAIGTTTTRALETVMTKHGRFEAERENANLTIIPGYKFKAIDALLTNFHLPQSSLLVLVSTFAGHQLIMDAYRHAVSKSYRFYSYGDCMLII